MVNSGFDLQGYQTPRGRFGTNCREHENFYYYRYGARTFTTTRIIPGIVAGQTLRIAKMPNRVGYPSAARENYMEGTVTSYSGTTLTMNVTQTGGSGIWTFWWIATQPQTTIVNNYNNGSGNNNGATPLLKVSEPPSGSAEISGLQMMQAAGSNSALIGVYASQYTAPKTLIRDCWFKREIRTI